MEMYFKFRILNVYAIICIPIGEAFYCFFSEKTIDKRYIRGTENTKKKTLLEFKCLTF